MAWFVPGTLYFDNGVAFPDIGGATFSGWLEPMELVSYESLRPDVINVSSIGALTLQDNWYAPVQLQAQVACDAATSAAKDVYANLLPSEGDVDLGAETRQQFQQVGLTLPVAVRIRTPAGRALKSFQLELGPFPTAASGAPTAKDVAKRALLRRNQYGNRHGRSPRSFDCHVLARS